MVDTLMVAKGVDGLVELFDDRIKINRRGFSSSDRVLPGGTEFLIGDITSIEFKKAGEIIDGYIQFAFMGEQASDEGDSMKTQQKDSVMFVARQQKAFEALRVEVESKIMAVMVGSESHKIKELQVLENLLNKGMIDREQFAIRKKQLLGN